MKPIEFYIAIMAGAAYVYESNRDKPIASRFFITISSSALGLSIGPELSEFVFGSLPLTGLLVTALGFIFLEVLSAVISDTAFIKNLITKRVGIENEES